MEKEKIIAATVELGKQIDVLLMPLLQKFVEQHPGMPDDAIVAVLAGAAGNCCGMVDGNLEAAKGAMAMSYEHGLNIRKAAIAAQQKQGGTAPTP